MSFRRKVLIGLAVLFFVRLVLVKFYETTVVLGLPSVKVGQENFHDEYENSWISMIDPKSFVVWVETIDSKVMILIHPTSQSDIIKYREGSIAPTTFHCVKINGNCSFAKPYQLYVRNSLVQVVRWKFLKEQQKEKEAEVQHGPGSGDYMEGLMVYMKNGSRKSYFHLKAVDQNKLKLIQKVKRGDKIKLFLPEDVPYKAFVNGLEMDIVALIL